MRIRKRPQYPSCTPDLTSTLVPQPTEAVVEAGGVKGNKEERWDDTVGVAGGRETSFHHNGDLPVLEPQHQYCITHQSVGNPPPFNRRMKNIKVQQQPGKQEEGVQLVEAAHKSLKNTEDLHNGSNKSYHEEMVDFFMKKPIKNMVKEAKFSKKTNIPLTVDTFTITSTTASRISNGDRMIKEEEDELDEVLRSDGNWCKKNRKRRPPEALMEGSRCSRVNGRGWRCHQLTLVGYSLCEHHLGKGRLRNMNSVRSKKEECQLHKKHHVLENNKNGEEEDQVMEKTIIDDARKRKIGMVKAKSISSLLDQTCEDVSKKVMEDGAVERDNAATLI